ncbi:protein Cep78 homolog [Toxorhynchites rutilus septentrionalis]|uniref:protein Cep78 homolog n=1 Tax=Toxorhynchites rutilus septentrionalis TaxID=329112 RepID=UPI0024798697|nr:protein Cep78 homolog [Toxorhynchites rutilus septentrionalis]
MTNCKRVNTTNRRFKDFHRRYLALCRARNFPPLAELSGIRSGGGSGVYRCASDQQLHKGVDLYGDRFKETDWQLIADALIEDGSLEFLAIRLRKVYNDVLDNGYIRTDGNFDRPIILKKRLFTRLIEGLAHFLVNNQVVKVFVLEALPIQDVYMATLVDALQHNNSITELSLARSAIRDEGCETVCRAVMHLPRIESLNLSGCQLTVRGCRSIAELIKFQKIQRFAQSWQHSLRYRDVDMSKIQGLRNIMLNSNPDVGDEGLCELTEVLKDDEWIRQVHFRSCGLTDKGAKFLVDCLNMNKAIEKFDIRGNGDISNVACHEILVKLGIDMESSDSSQSLNEKKGVGQGKMRLSEQVKYLQQQLTAERLRSAQLQHLVEQLHLQQTECVIQLNNLKEEYRRIVDQHEEMVKTMKRQEKGRPKSRKTALRKSRSEALPTSMFSRNANAGRIYTRGSNKSKSEMTMKWIHDGHVTATNCAGGYAKRPHVLEGTIGDTGLNTRLNDIAELNEGVHTLHKNFEEAGFGDMGVGCSAVRIRSAGYNNKRSVQLNTKEDTSEEEYFNDIGEPVDHMERNDVNKVWRDCEEEGDDDSGTNSISGADLLNMVVKKRSMEHTGESHSVFLSVYDADEN